MSLTREMSVSESATADSDRQMVDETRRQRTISLSISERRDIYFHSSQRSIQKLKFILKSVRFNIFESVRDNFELVYIYICKFRIVCLENT